MGRVILLVQIEVGLVRRNWRSMNPGVLEDGGLDVAVVGGHDGARARAW